MPRLLPGTSHREWQQQQQQQQQQQHTPSSLPPLDGSAGQYAVQEYIHALIAHDASNVQRICALPREVDKNLWLYEHLRVLMCDLGRFTVALGAVCSQHTCPSMMATADWEFLCAAHALKPSKCSAIDYCTHTLTGFVSLLHNAELFPNRVSVAEKSASKHFANVMRRLYRVLAHAFYHHREMFDEFERETRVARRFVALATMFQLMDKQAMTPPIEV